MLHNYKSKCVCLDTFVPSVRYGGLPGRIIPSTVTSSVAFIYSFTFALSSVTAASSPSRSWVVEDILCTGSNGTLPQRAPCDAQTARRIRDLYFKITQPRGREVEKQLQERTMPKDDNSKDETVSRALSFEDYVKEANGDVVDVRGHTKRTLLDALNVQCTRLSPLFLQSAYS